MALTDSSPNAWQCAKKDTVNIYYLLQSPWHNRMNTDFNGSLMRFTIGKMSHRRRDVSIFRNLYDDMNK